MRWFPTLSDTDSPGMLIATGGSRNGGAHGSLSRYDMNNTLVASGPDFKKGYFSTTPSGNIDIAPTILHILGIKPRGPMDGRVLREAFVEDRGPLPDVKEDKLEASRRSGYMQWHQYLKTLEVDGALYVDEGNGEAALK
jgi:arylsulfatase A-like enzyme